MASFKNSFKKTGRGWGGKLSRKSMLATFNVVGVVVCAASLASVLPSQHTVRSELPTLTGGILGCVDVGQQDA